RRQSDSCARGDQITAGRVDEVADVGYARFGKTQLHDSLVEAVAVDSDPVRRANTLRTLYASCAPTAKLASFSRIQPIMPARGCSVCAYCLRQQGMPAMRNPPLMYCSLPLVAQAMLPTTDIGMRLPRCL